MPGSVSKAHPAVRPKDAAPGLAQKGQPAGEVRAEDQAIVALVHHGQGLGRRGQVVPRPIGLGIGLAQGVKDRLVVDQGQGAGLHGRAIKLAVHLEGGPQLGVQILRGHGRRGDGGQLARGHQPGEAEAVHRHHIRRRRVQQPVFQGLGIARGQLHGRRSAPDPCSMEPLDLGSRNDYSR